jgi:hypothetical protein
MSWFTARGIGQRIVRSTVANGQSAIWDGLIPNKRALLSGRAQGEGLEEYLESYFSFWLAESLEPAILSLSLKFSPPKPKL